MGETREDLCRRLAGLLPGWEYQAHFRGLPWAHFVSEAGDKRGAPAHDAPLPEIGAFVFWVIELADAEEYQVGIDDMGPCVELAGRDWRVLRSATDLVTAVLLAACAAREGR